MRGETVLGSSPFQRASRRLCCPIFCFLTEILTTMVTLHRSTTALFLSLLFSIIIHVVVAADLILDGGDSGWQTNAWCEYFGHYVTYS
jgi:hypothetical protein